ncbi:DUF2780 domain-containing protein [Hydrogenimonas sp. SS33]|uniref:DUF2780 domain-containing protein n=1 Tax=Hydrogenimonas leucolamina TaxID=2954236 RepID=UPI00336C2934
MMKKVAIATLAASLSLQAGFFDDAVKSVGSMNRPSQSAPATASTNTSQASGLLSSLTGQLGISQKQAAGGTAALMNAAAQQMPQSNYTQLLGSVPGLGGIVKNNSGLVNGAMSMMGNTDMVGQAFKMLGMDNSMISKFAPALLGYIKQYATPENVALLKQAWSAFL